MLMEAAVRPLTLPIYPTNPTDQEAVMNTKILSAIAALMMAAQHDTEHAGTQPKQPAPAAHPLHGDWQVRRIRAAAPAAPLTVSIRADGRLTVRGGCNGLSANYRVSGRRLHLSHAMSTLMACPDESLMQADDQIDRALRQTTGYRISGKTLWLLDRRGRKLIETQKQPAHD